ncbi:hypothetical protein D3C71_1391260 [compost metagenome]
MDQFPNVAVQVFEAVRVHEAVVLRLARYGAAGSACAGDQVVDFGAAFARQADQHFGCLFGVHQRFAGKALEEIARQEHGVDVIADDHAGALLVGEIRVEGEAQLLEEVLRFLHVADGDVDEYLLVHGFVS